MLTPPITEEYIGPSNEKLIFEYYECDSYDHLPQDQITQCYAVAFHKDKMVIVYQGAEDTWGLVGGTVEKGETLEQTLKREIQEESNMKVISFKPIGYQKITGTLGIHKTVYQLRYFAIVEPFGPFLSDPAGAIDKIAEIDPIDYKKYFDWKRIGDAIINRAVEFKKDII